MTWHRIDDPENPPPKDGTVIWLATDRERMIAWWSPLDEDGEPQDYPWAFLEMDGAINGMTEREPTHWQPVVIPPPPVTP